MTQTLPDAPGRVRGRTAGGPGPGVAADVQGHTVPGGTAPGHSVPGHSVPGHTLQGARVPGEAVPGPRQAPVDPDRAPRTPARPRLPYLPGLDGLRALAVVGVLLYHGDVAAFPGGFLGVEVFFVLSGFLITSLLLEEWTARGHIDFRAFWAARARRLLPALSGVLLLVSVASLILYREELGKLKGPVVAALTYTSNWYLIFSEQSYFELTGRPSALEHLWSLAVEEQFYLVWPIVLAVVLSRWGMRRLMLGTLVAAVAATLLMAVFYPVEGDPSRVYLGTDTRAAGLLVGALLAYVLVPGRLRATGRAPVAAVVTGTGLVALGGVLWFMTRVTAYEPWLWRGGFLLLALVTAVLITAAVHPDARLLSQVVLGNRVARWLGRRSYGIYLWHWPIFVVTRPRLDLPFEGPLVLALRLGLTLGVAELSYRYLEQPVRRGDLGRWWRSRRTMGTEQRQTFRLQVAGAAVGVVAAVAVLTAVLSTAAPVTATPAGPTTVQATPGTPAAPTTPATAGSTASPGPSAGGSWSPLPASLGTVTAIGDSVMAGAAESTQGMLGAAGTVDAAVGRQWNEGIAAAAALASAGTLGDTVVVHLGSNAAVSRAQVERMMTTLRGASHVVLVTAYVPRPWGAATNKTLRWAASAYDTVVLADWRAAALARPPDLMADDGMHVRNATGARLYAQTIRDALLVAAQRSGM